MIRFNGLNYDYVERVMDGERKFDKGRIIDTIIIHCTATEKNRPVAIEDIDRWHKEKGFVGIGYHFVVHQNGDIEQGRQLYRVGAHCKGFNASSIGIAYVGGVDDTKCTNTLTPEQDQSLFNLVTALAKLYNIPIGRIYGHNDLNPNKVCPCFFVGHWYAKHLQ